MFCIVEINTVINDDYEEQTVGRVFGPIEDVSQAGEQASDLAELKVREFPGYEVNELEPDDIDGGESYETGFVIENSESIKAFYLVKQLFTVAIPTIEA